MKNLFDNQQIDRKKYQKFFTEIKEEAAPGGTAPSGLITPSYGGTKIVFLRDIPTEPTEKKGGATIIGAFITTTATKPRKAPYKKPQAVKHLEQLADLDNQRRHPHTPAKYLARCKYRDDTYSGLVTCIVDYVRLQGGTAQRLAPSRPQDTRQTVRDVIGRKYEIGSVDYRPEPSGSGADIHAVIHGYSVMISARPGGHCFQDGDVYFFSDFSQFLRWFNQAFKQ